MMFYVYILRNENDKHYIGYSSDLRKRLAAHNAGANKSTKHSQWSLIYYEAYLNESAARKREIQLKHHGRAKQAILNRLGN